MPSEIIERLEKLTGNKMLPFNFSDEVADALGVGKRNAKVRNHIIPLALNGSLDAAITLVELMLPGWWWQLGKCSVSDDARLCPDFNHPVHGERLMREFGQVEGDPSVYWQDITDVDLRPAGRPAIALLIALFRALEVSDAE